jgi:hypothetical protein
MEEMRLKEACFDLREVRGKSSELEKWTEMPRCYTTSRHKQMGACQRTHKRPISMTSVVSTGEEAGASADADEHRRGGKKQMSGDLVVTSMRN